MAVSRLEHITKIGVEQMGDLADSLGNPNVLRLENLDTDLRPPQSALDFTRQAVDDDDANSYLPFSVLIRCARPQPHWLGDNPGTSMIGKPSVSSARAGYPVS